MSRSWKDTNHSHHQEGLEVTRNEFRRMGGLPVVFFKRYIFSFHCHNGFREANECDTMLLTWSQSMRLCCFCQKFLTRLGKGIFSTSNHVSFLVIPYLCIFLSRQNTTWTFSLCWSHLWGVGADKDTPILVKGRNYKRPNTCAGKDSGLTTKNRTSGRSARSAGLRT